MKTGKCLIRDVNQCVPAWGEMAFWWLGQQGFIVKLGRTVLYIDPFLTPSPRRRIPPLLRPEDVTNADVVCGSHDHTDHIDRAAWPRLAAASPRARFVVPDALLPRLAHELGIPPRRFTGLDDGKRRRIGDVSVTGIAAAHEFLDQDPVSGKFPYLGYVIEGNGCALFHAGDMCVYEGLMTKLRRWKFTAAFLPINGRDAKRLAAGCIGNMTYQEAVDLAGTLEVAYAIPGHYDMFAGNSGDPVAFAEYLRVKYPRVRPVYCRHGERMLLGSITGRIG